MAAATDPAWLDGGRMLPLVEDFYTKFFHLLLYFLAA